MEAIGRLAGGIAHDFNNLLGVISGYSELLRHRYPDHPGADRIRQIESAGSRAAGLTRQLLAFSRKQVLEPKVVDVGALVGDLGRMLQRLLGEDVRLTIRSEADVDPVRADPTQLEQVVMNLTVNARDAMPLGGELTISVGMTEADARDASLPAGRYVALSVRDTGCGMDAATLSHVFEPFFTTKERGKGTGLGLATVYGIVKQTGGCVRVESAPGAGSTFTILLPPTQERSAPAQLAAAPPRGGRETVLVVEDEPGMLELARETLEQNGYSVLAASSGDEALRLAASHATSIELLLTDVVMPGIGGPALAERLTRRQPRLRVVFMSGYTADRIAHHGALAEGTLLLQKPFRADALLRKVAQALGRGVEQAEPATA
jgi:CheY-like chemotaxis protein